MLLTNQAVHALAVLWQNAPAPYMCAIRAMLAGRQLVHLEEGLSVERTLPHGGMAAVLGVLCQLNLERLLSRQPWRVVVMICQIILAPGPSSPSPGASGKAPWPRSSVWAQVTEAKLLGALDWLLARQDRIEKALGLRHLTDGFALYNLSSGYLEGCSCPWAPCR